MTGTDWDEILTRELEEDYFKSLCDFLAAQYAAKTVYPPRQFVFNALKNTPLAGVKAVILGQDPYHGPGQAHGLCFSVRGGIEKPPSLVNIYSELLSDTGAERQCGDLTDWARQGVLLLNTTMSVERGRPLSHKGRGWETLTDKLIKEVNNKTTPVVFMLWGANAGEKQSLITNNIHLILKAPHPSPLSAHRGFFGCRHFSKANEFLKQNGIDEIKW